MIIVADVIDKNEKCRACSNNKGLIEIRATDEIYNISDSLILCEECKRALVDRLLPF